METVSLDKIFKIYQDREIEVPALTDLSLQIQQGEFVVLAGPSGSGKTTLLNIIGTLDQPDRGRVFLEGRDVSRLPRNALAELRLKKIGFIFQSSNLISVLTAQAVGLEGLSGRRPWQMSGGQAQRAAVARAVVAEPRLILADEPTANLDSKTGEQLIDLLESYNQSKQITFIIASHDPLVINRAKRIIPLKDGRIVQD
jgi:putative ABC transport system ATP-binding protein